MRLRHWRKQAFKMLGAFAARNRRRRSPPVRRLVVECCESRTLLAQVVLSPVDDNSVFQESPTFSNGAGIYLYSGQAGQIGFGARRALLKFDVAGSVPAGSTIDSVSLRLHTS